MARQVGAAGGAGDELLDVVVIGGSQAGLAMAWHLARRPMRRGSALLGLVQEDAAYLAGRVTGRAPARQAAARPASQQPG